MCIRQAMHGCGTSRQSGTAPSRPPRAIKSAQSYDLLDIPHVAVYALLHNTVVSVRGHTSGTLDVDMGPTSGIGEDHAGTSAAVASRYGLGIVLVVALLVGGARPAQVGVSTVIATCNTWWVGLSGYDADTNTIEVEPTDITVVAASDLGPTSGSTVTPVLIGLVLGAAFTGAIGGAWYLGRRSAP